MVGGAHRGASRASTDPPDGAASVVRVFVLGVDPGLSRCGYCVLEETDPARGRARAAALGVLTTAPDDPLPERLAELQRELRALLVEFAPRVLAVERVLFQVNVRTAMSVGQASGIAIHLDDLIKAHRIVDWVRKTDVQNRMRQAMEAP